MKLESKGCLFCDLSMAKLEERHISVDSRPIYLSQFPGLEDLKLCSDRNKLTRELRNEVLDLETP